MIWGRLLMLKEKFTLHLLIGLIGWFVPVQKLAFGGFGRGLQKLTRVAKIEKICKAKRGFYALS